METGPLAHVTAKKLRRTSNKPAEWIGTSTTGDKIYIVADARNLIFGVGDYTQVLTSILKGKAAKVKHTGFTSSVSTSKMLEVTGLRLADGTTVNELEIGRVL